MCVYVAQLNIASAKEWEDYVAAKANLTTRFLPLSGSQSVIQTISDFQFMLGTLALSFTVVCV